MMLLLLLASALTDAKAQHSLLNYGNGKLSALNPAFYHPEVGDEASLFPASSFAFYIESPFSKHSITTTLEGQKFLDLGKMEAKAGKHSLLMLDAAFDYFSISRQLGKHRWQFRLSDQVQGGIQPDKTFFSLLNKGNVPFQNEWLETRLPLGLMQFTSLGATTVRPISDQLKIGFTVKLYAGKAYVQAAPQFRLFTANEAEYLIIEMDGKVRASLPLDQNINPQGNVNGWALPEGFGLANYLFHLSNPGLGLDAGLNYRYNERWNFSLSITDLGAIAWLGKRNSLQLSGSFRWDGADISHLAASKFIEKKEGISLADSFLFNNLHPLEQPFLSAAPARLNLGIQLIRSENISFSAVNQVHYFNRLVNVNSLLALHWKLHRQWLLNLGLSHFSHGIPSMPLGFVFSGNRIELTAGLHNAWGLLLPALANINGGSLTFRYRFDYLPFLPSLKNYPFYQPYPGK